MGWWQRLVGSTPRVQPVSVNDDNFRSEVLRSELPVLVDFWSDGCAPCRQLESVILGLAATYEGRVKVCEANTAGVPRVGVRYEIMATPTVLYFHKGQLVERVVGFRGSLYHRELIDGELLAPPAPGPPGT